MMPPPQGSGPFSTPAGAKTFLLLLAFGLAAYLLGPPLYWHFVESISAAARHTDSCPPCICDCPPTENASMLLPGFGNKSADCTDVDPRIREEMDKSFVELLTEELKVQASVADETQQRADSTHLEVKKLSSQYQKEAEKCNLGMETCEEAREKAEEAFVAQMTISATWEQRARDLGWKHYEKSAQDFN